MRRSNANTRHAPVPHHDGAEASARSRPGALTKPDDGGWDLASTTKLVHAIQLGDEGAQDALYRRYFHRFQRWAHGRLPTWARGMSETQDVVQTALIKAFRNVGQFDPTRQGGFHGYVRRAVLNTINDEIRSKSRRPTAPSSDRDDDESDAPSPLEELAGAEILDSYERALQRLPELERECIIARVELGLGFRDLGQEHGMSEDQARYVVSKALLQLAREMRRKTDV